MPAADTPTDTPIPDQIWDGLGAWMRGTFAVIGVALAVSATRPGGAGGPHRGQPPASPHSPLFPADQRQGGAVYPAAFPTFLGFYNTARDHSALGHVPPLLHFFSRTPGTTS